MPVRQESALTREDCIREDCLRNPQSGLSSPSDFISVFSAPSDPLEMPFTLGHVYRYRVIGAPTWPHHLIDLSTGSKMIDVVVLTGNDNLATQAQESELDRLLAQWGTYCEALFEDLATAAPTELADLLLSGHLPPARLTFAAEILGRMAPGPIAEPPLIALLAHASPLVREGAVYGLSRHLSEVIRQRLNTVAAGDSSRAVREAATEVLEA